MRLRVAREWRESSSGSAFPLKAALCYSVTLFHSVVDVQVTTRPQERFVGAGLCIWCFEGVRPLVSAPGYQSKSQ